MQDGQPENKTTSEKIKEAFKDAVTVAQILFTTAPISDIVEKNYKSDESDKPKVGGKNDPPWCF